MGKKKMLTREQLGEELCNYCPLEESQRGVKCYGGEPSFCCDTGACDEAYDNYQDGIYESNIRKFQPGLVYVFTTKKYKRWVDEIGVNSRGNWWKQCNGREVEAMSDTEGRINDYSISPYWCKCIGKEDIND